MKNILWTLPAAAIAVIAGCQKPTDLVCEVSPEIFLTTEKVTAPADGGKCSIVYRIDDPSVDGKMTPAPSDDWMSGFIVSDTLITFEVEANNTESLRNGSIVLNYTWADKSVTAEVSVIQPAVGMEPAVELGLLDNIPSAGGSFEIPYGIINPVDGGTVSAASEAAWIENLTAADMTFTPDYSQVYSSADNGQILMNNFLVDGTVTVSYEGSDIVFEAFVTDETGLTHHVTYTGQANYILDM